MNWSPSVHVAPDATGAGWPGDDTLASAHEAAARIESRAESTVADVVAVIVHTEPA